MWHRISIACLALVQLSLVLGEVTLAHAGAGPDSEWVNATAHIPGALFELRYASYHNFVGQPIPGYECSTCWLTRPAAEQLQRVQADLSRHSMTVKLYDCYRPQVASDFFVEWAKELQRTEMKREFYPFVNKSSLFEDGYIAARSGHSRGSTVDITVVPLVGGAPPPQEPFLPNRTALIPCMAPASKRFHDNSANFGTGYDCFSEVSHTAFPLLPPDVRQRRQWFVELMEKHGFSNYANEWWHFTLVNEPFPHTYFNRTLCEGF